MNTSAPSAPSVDLMIDLSEPLAQINKELAPGMTAELMLMGNLVAVRYTIRVMVKGKRITSGPYYSKRTAMDAWIAAKSGQNMQLRALTVNSSTAIASALSAVKTGKIAGVGPITDAEESTSNVLVLSADNCTALKEAKLAEDMTMQALDDLVVDSETPGYLFTAESTLEITDSAGKVWHISPAMQREYNAWCFANSAASQSAQASE